MWSIGGAVMVWAAVCAAAVTFALRRAHAEMEPARASFERLHVDVTGAIDRAARDSGRARASRQVLLRHGSPPDPR